MKAYLQILSSGTADCPPSVVLHFDSQRYLINCGEGTQRLCMESKMRFSKLKTILLTRTHWDCMGGLPGMLLTLSDVGVRNMKVLGGENLTHALTSTRHFVYRNTMAVETLEFEGDTKDYRDGNLRITAVRVNPTNFERSLPLARPASRTFNRSPPGTPHGSTSNVSPVLSTGSERNDSPAVGSKRPSDEIQSPVVEEPTNDKDTRKLILESMFNLSKNNGGHPLVAKKVKRDPRAKNASVGTDQPTDVEQIEAAQQTQSKAVGSNNCGGGRPVNGRFMDLPRTSPNPVAISYICQSPDYVGKFDKQAAVALGVKPGKLFGELVNGHSVASTTGEMVHPHQVISGARAGRVFMVIDCPTVDYIPELVRAAEFEKFYGPASAVADCIVHLTGHDILSHPDYQAWMGRFGEATQHIVAHQEYCSQKLVWRSQSQGCYKLSMLDSNIFPIPYYDNTPAHELSKDLEGVPVKAALAESMLTFLLEPSTGLDRSEVIPPIEVTPDYKSLKFSTKPYLREYFELAEKAQAEIEAETAAGVKGFPGENVVMTALGTGSSYPSKYRNVSATLLETPMDGTFLLDVGEGTYGQMFRQFGGYKRSLDQASSVDDRIKHLKGIFVSHLHADHHLGIVTVIDRWNKLRDEDTEPLTLIAPLKFNTFLQELSDTQDFGYHKVRFIESEDIVFWRDPVRDHRKRAVQPAVNAFLGSSGFREVSTVDVIHCPWSYGISMTHRTGWKIVYSGDTRPCGNLVKAGQGATVLLHEATFEDDMEDEAQKKKHSTTQEAIMVGEGMEAKFTMLTHFSQRYPKIPRFDSEDKSTMIGICFDLMSVKFGEIRKLPKFLPALQVLYNPQSDEAKEATEESKDPELKGLEQHTE